MVIGSAAGLGNLPTIGAAVALAFLFGYGLTSLPLLRSGLALGAVASIAAASDTLSIAIMEAIDNLFVFFIPGAMEAGLLDPLFWGSIAGGFAVAFPVAFLANIYLIKRGKGHALVHQYHHHR